MFPHIFFFFSFPFRKALLFIATCIAVGVAQVPKQGENALFITEHLCNMLVDEKSKWLLLLVTLGSVH